MRHTLAIAIMLLPLAGCGDKPESADAGAKDGGVAAPVAAPLAAAPTGFQPGKWQATSELVKMEMPGMPPEIAKANVGKKTIFEHCITAEQAAKPPSDFFTDRRNKNCTAKSFTMAGGKIDATLSCTGERSGSDMTMTIKGDYHPTNYTATMTMVGAGMPGGGEMKMTATTTGQRVGECDAKVAGG